MKFFKPRDFCLAHSHKLLTKCPEEIANLANAKLEREGIVVYSCSQNDPGAFAGSSYVWGAKDSLLYKDSHKALLICIEPIEACTHPSEKVRNTMTYYKPKNNEVLSTEYQCSCGVRVTPESFKVIE